MDGFFDAADDLLDSIQTKKTNKTPAKRPLEASERKSKNDELVNKAGSGPLEKKMKYLNKIYLFYFLPDCYIN